MISIDRLNKGEVNTIRRIAAEKEEEERKVNIIIKNLKIEDRIMNENIYYIIIEEFFYKE